MITIKKSFKDLISNLGEKFEMEHGKVEEILKNIKSIREKTIFINPDGCIRCNLCVEECPVDAIKKPTIKRPAEITDKCVKCEICAQTCPVNAIEVIEGRAYVEGDKVVYELKELNVLHRKLRLKNYKFDKDKCVFCGICARFCPTNAIEVEIGKNFDVDLNLCMGCGACDYVCPKNAIKVENELGEVIFNKIISVNNDVCVRCLACVEVCPVNAIKGIAEGVEINKEKCIFCGRCRDICPVSAIKIEKINKD
jgi:ferredoxin